MSSCWRARQTSNSSTPQISDFTTNYSFTTGPTQNLEIGVSTSQPDCRAMSGSILIKAVQHKEKGFGLPRTHSSWFKVDRCHLCRPSRRSRGRTFSRLFFSRLWFGTRSRSDCRWFGTPSGKRQSNDRGDGKMNAAKIVNLTILND